VIPLRLGLYLLHVTDAVFDEARLGLPAADGRDQFARLTSSLLCFARDLAHGRRFAYVETNYFGGTGAQAAGVWLGEQVELEPRRGAVGTINLALRLMGATANDVPDEFAAVGLDRYRSNEAWIESLDEGQCEPGYPPFDDAVAKLRTFLRAQGVSDEIRWITSNDCALQGSQLFVRLREDAHAEARGLYASAAERRLGVMLAMCCAVGEEACCYVYAPATQLDSEYALMPDGLKLSAPAFVRKAKLIPVGDDKRWAKLCALPERRWLSSLMVM
jgi:hypothetical protein